MEERTAEQLTIFNYFLNPCNHGNTYFMMHGVGDGVDVGGGGYAVVHNAIDRRQSRIQSIHLGR